MREVKVPREERPREKEEEEKEEEEEEEVRGYWYYSKPLNDSLHSLSLTMRKRKPRKSLELAQVHPAGDGQSSEQPALAPRPEGGPRSLPQGLREAEVSLPSHPFTPLQSAAECRSQLRIRVSAPYSHQHSPPPPPCCASPCQERLQLSSSRKLPDRPTPIALPDPQSGPRILPRCRVLGPDLLGWQCRA